MSIIDTIAPRECSCTGRRNPCRQSHLEQQLGHRSWRITKYRVPLNQQKEEVVGRGKK